MAKSKPRYSMEEFARRGDELFDRKVRPLVANCDENDFVVIDIESGEFEVDADEIAATDRLRTRVPNAQMWLRRVGSPSAREFGLHARTVKP